MLAVVARALLAQAGVLAEHPVHLALLASIRHLDGVEGASGKARAAQVVGQKLALEPADHDRGQLGVIGRHRAMEALIVEQLEQGGEALGIAVD